MAEERYKKRMEEKQRLIQQELKVSLQVLTQKMLCRKEFLAFFC